MFNIDLDKTPALKTLLGYLLPLPFWFISLELFHADFFYRSDFVLIITYCVCFTLAAGVLFSNMLYEAYKDELNIAKNKSDNDKKEKEESEGILNPRMVAGGIVLQIILLSLFLFVCYSWVYFTENEVEFYYFIVGYFSLPFILNLILFFKAYGRDRTRIRRASEARRQDNETESQKVIP